LSNSLPEKEPETTHRSPFKTKGLNKRLHACDKLVARLVDAFSSFEIGTLRSIKHKEGKKGGLHECSTAKKQGPQNRVFSFLSILGMEEPDTGVDAYSVTAKTFWVGLKSLFDSKLWQRPGFSGGFEDLERGLE